MQNATAELAYRTDSSTPGGFSGTPSALLGFGVDKTGTRIVITYNAESQTYTVRNEKVPTATSATFGPADRVSSIEYVDRYASQSVGVSDSLITFGNARQNASTDVPPIILSYVSFGVWKHIETATATTTNSHFLFGWPTVPASMPTTGTATYSLIVSGNAVESGPAFGTQQYEFGGTSIIRANFSAATLTTELNLDRSGILGSYSGSGTINSSVFAGSLDTRLPIANRPDNGQFSGGFFGPNASEVGYVFSITRTNPGYNAGAAIAPRDVWFIGAAVGKKD
jgi:hypothetical protein